MATQYRPLLPAALGDNTTSGNQDGNRAQLLAREKKTRRKPIMSCNQCRKSKKACDSLRPACRSCLKRRVGCIYPPVEGTTIKDKVEGLNKTVKVQQEVLRHLRIAPEHAAIEVLRLLRADTRHNLDLVPTSKPNRPRVAFSCTMSVFETELMLNHATVYPTISPVTQDVIDRLLQIGPLEHPFALPQTDSDQVVVSGPPRPSRYFHSLLLSQLEMAVWSTVSITNEAAGVLISFYLETKHSLLPFFDEQLFLVDLLHQRHVFCTPFLVNAILYTACQYYAIVDEQATAYVAPFFKEAKKHWNRNKSLDTVLNVAAIQIFSMGCHVEGRDKLGRELLFGGRRMAENLQLFGDNRDNGESFEPEYRTEEWNRVASQVAWSSYILISCHTLHFRDKPISQPPILPIVHTTGELFETVCGIWTIVQEVATVYLAQVENARFSLSIQFAQSKYEQLLALTDSLPTQLEHRPAALFMLSSSFHTAVLNIFRPFVQPLSFYGEGSFCSFDEHASEIFDASVRQLKRMIYECLVAYDGLSHSIFVTNAVIFLCNAMLRRSATEESHSYFLLCLRIMEKMYLGLPAVLEVAQAFLTLAMERGFMTSIEARDVLKRFRRRDDLQLNNDATSSVIVDHDLALVHAKSATSHSIAPRFERLLQFDDITIGEFGDWALFEEGYEAGTEDMPIDLT